MVSYLSKFRNIRGVRRNADVVAKSLLKFGNDNENLYFCNKIGGAVAFRVCRRRGLAYFYDKIEPK